MFLAIKNHVKTKYKTTNYLYVVYLYYTNKNNRWYNVNKFISTQQVIIDWS